MLSITRVQTNITTKSYKLCTLQFQVTPNSSSQLKSSSSEKSRRKEKSKGAPIVVSYSPVNIIPSEARILQNKIDDAPVYDTYMH